MSRSLLMIVNQFIDHLKWKQLHLINSDLAADQTDQLQIRCFTNPFGPIAVGSEPVSHVTIQNFPSLSPRTKLGFILNISRHSSLVPGSVFWTGIQSIVNVYGLL